MSAKKNENVHSNERRIVSYPKEAICPKCEIVLERPGSDLPSCPNDPSHKTIGCLMLVKSGVKLSNDVYSRVFVKRVDEFTAEFWVVDPEGKFHHYDGLELNKSYLTGYYEVDYKGGSTQPKRTLTETVGRVMQFMSDTWQKRNVT